MQVTPSALRAISKGFEGRFRGAYDAATPILAGRVATDVPSSTRSNVYGWMTKLPRMREWVGERVLQNLSARSYEITNRSFELTISVDRDDIEDDVLGVYAPWLDEMGAQARMWGDDLLVELLEAGITNPCWDGQLFFDTDHPVSPDDSGAGTYTNRFVGALTEDNLWAVRQRMMGVKGEDGRSLRIMPNLLIVPPALEKTARQIIDATIDAAGATNISAGLVQYSVNPDLSSDTRWYLMDVARPIRPFVLQTRRAPEFVSRDMPDDERVFNAKQFVYGVDNRGNAGYALPFLAATAAAADGGGTALS